MSRLDRDRLNVTFSAGVSQSGPVASRHYTLTHSDMTGELFLSIGLQYNRRQISGWYTRLLRDEVLAAWNSEHAGFTLRVHCHVSGGLVLGSARWRDQIFRRELPLVLEAFRYGDRRLFEAIPTLDEAPIWVHFHARQKRYSRVEQWATLAKYATHMQSKNDL